MSDDQPRKLGPNDSDPSPWARRINALAHGRIPDDEKIDVEPTHSIVEALANVVGMTTRPTVGYLTAARTKAGLRQSDVAQRIGTSQSTVAEWETGTPPRFSGYRRLCDLFGEKPELRKVDG